MTPEENFISSIITQAIEDGNATLWMTHSKSLAEREVGGFAPVKRAAVTTEVNLKFAGSAAKT